MTNLYTLREEVESMRGLNLSEVFIVLKEASKVIERKGSSIWGRYFRRCEVVEVAGGFLEVVVVSSIYMRGKRGGRLFWP